MSDEYPPQIEYPEGHSPMCPRACAHECHQPYDEWAARQQLPPLTDEVLAELHAHTVSGGRQMEVFIQTRPQDWEPAARALLFGQQSC